MEPPALSVEDISVRRQAEHALREADARKDEFLATLAHELRNPLAPIANATRVLARHEPLSAAGQRAVAMIERQAAQMKRLLDDLLEVSRITRGAIELRPEAMRLDAALREAVEAALPAFEAKHQRLHLQLPREPMPLVADPVRLAQILGNLLTNACKYTPEGGQVHIEAQQDAAGVTVRVIDNGIGIAADQLEAVFGLFVQAEPGVGPYQGGLGIGLALVRRLVQMHGGHVRAESPGLGLGAAFTVWLPRG